MLQMIELKQEGKEIFDFDKFIKNVNFWIYYVFFIAG